MVAIRHSKSWAIPNLNIKDNSLVLYFPLWYPYSDMTGSTIYSYDRNRVTGAVTGATWGTQGRTYDGNDFINANGAASTLQDMTTGTIEVWVKLDDQQSGAFFSVSDSADAESRFILYWNSGNGIYALCSEAGTTYYNHAFGSDGTPPRTMTTGTWYHLLFYHNGTNILLILDGATYGLVSGATDETKFLAAVNTIDTVTMGRNLTSGGSGTFLKGVEGEIRVYNRILPMGEINRNEQVTKWRYV